MNRKRLFGEDQTGLAPGGITIKSPNELDAMRGAGQVVAQAIEELKAFIQPGVTTGECDALAERVIRGAGATPSFKGYQGFPATICVSLNEEIVHGIPGGRTIRDGDIVSVDVGAVVNGFHGDAAVTVIAGNAPDGAVALVDVTREALERAIQMVLPGKRVGDISSVMEGYAEPKGYSVVREYVGHGVGRRLHEEPPVPNFGPPSRGPLLRPGMVIAIEPMVIVGGWQTRVLEDQWTVVTADGTLSAHFEHTIAVLEDRAEVLTRSPVQVR